MFVQQQYEDQNKGLPTHFQLENGKFALKGGRAKVDDNVGMLLSFVGWFRFYTQDYVINPYKFLQNSTSYLFQFKNILRLKILDIGKRYVPFAKFYAVDIPIDYNNRKATTIYINFQYQLKNTDDYQTIKKVVV